MCFPSKTLRSLPSPVLCSPIGDTDSKAATSIIQWPELQSSGQGSSSKAGLAASVRRRIGGIMSDSPFPRPKPNEKLVRVFDTEQESEALVVHGLLKSSGIDSDITSLDAQQDILPGVGGTIILVREEDAGKARRVIEEYRQAPGSDETAEIDISGIPPGED